MASTSVVFDILARDRASDKFQKVGNSAEKTKGQLQKFGRIAAAGAVAAGVGIAAFGVSAVKSASDAQQSFGATQTVFGKYAKSVIKDSRSAATAYGLSANEFRESSNLIGSLLKNQGVAQDQLGGKTKQLVALGADLSATYGGSAKDAVEALGSAFKGEFDPLEAYGVSLKQSTINTKAYALANVKSQTAFGKLSIAQQRAYQQQATMKLLMEQTKDAQGQFAKQTGTLAEQQQIAGAQFENLKAKIGGALLPVITSLFSFINTKGIPAIAGLVREMKTGTGTGGAIVATFKQVASTLGTVFTWIGNNQATVKTFVGIIGTAVVISKAWTVAQLALNLAMTANPIGLVVVGLAALAAGLVYAYKHSEKFRSIVQGAFAVVKAAASGVVGFFTGPVPAAFNKVKSAASSVLNWVKGNWPYLVGALAGPFGIAAVAIAKHWDGIKNGAKNVVSKVTSFFQGLPGKILGALGDLSGLLTNVGNSIIESLLAPLRAGADKVKGVLKGITDKIPDWKGPLDKDRVLLTPAGEAIMQSLINGFKKKWTPVKDFLQKVTDKVKETGDKLAGLVSQRNDFANSFRGFSSSIFGRDPGQDAEGNANPESVAGIKAFALKQRQDADTLARNVQRLVGLGLSKSLLTQLQSQGSSGVAQINALAGASKSDIAFLNQQDKATTAANQRAGMAAANAIYGADIKKAQQDNAAMIKALHDIKEELHGLGNGKLHAEVRGDHLVFVIRQEQKKKGKGDPFK